MKEDKKERIEVSKKEWNKEWTKNERTKGRKEERIIVKKKKQKKEMKKEEKETKAKRVKSPPDISV
jgi:hypothetical protein